MKKIIVTFVSALMLIACEKAAIDTTPTIEPVKGGSVTLKAIMPDFTSDTKASIADNGAFSWVVGTDVIAVRYVKAGQPDEYVPFTCSNAETCEFTGDPTEGYTLADSGGALAYYPYDYRGTPSDFSGSAADASKSFQMKATEIVDGKLIFQHDNALLKVTINNIPAIATSLVVGNSTLSLSEGGNLTVNVPVCQSSAAPLTISVKYGETALFTKSTSKEVAIQKGYIYTHIPTLTVAPEHVYLKSGMTGWTEADSGWEMGHSGAIYSTTINSIGTQYATVFVKYPNASTIIKMGPESNGTSVDEVKLMAGYSTAVKIIDRGEYTISFDSTTSMFSYVKNSSNVNFYLVGTENSWDITDTSMPLINMTADGKYYVIGQKGKYKVRYNTCWESTIGDPGNTSDSSNFGSADDASTSLIISIPTDGTTPSFNLYNEAYDNNVLCSSVDMHDEITTANYYPMSADAYNPNLWSVIKDIPDPNGWGGTKIKFKVGDDWWGTDANLSGVEYNSAGGSKDSSSDNFWVPKGNTLVVLNAKTQKIKFIKL